MDPCMSEAKERRKARRSRPCWLTYSSTTLSTPGWRGPSQPSGSKDTQHPFSQLRRHFPRSHAAARPHSSADRGLELLSNDLRVEVGMVLGEVPQDHGDGGAIVLLADRLPPD